MRDQLRATTRGIRSAILATATACLMVLAVSAVATAGAGAAGSGPMHLTAVGGSLFFTAKDGSRDRELWISDGSSVGTHRVKDIRPVGSSKPEELTNAGGTLYFSAHDGTAQGLWKSDGTEAGTQLIEHVHGASFTAFAGMLYFVTFSGGERQLWKSDGTPEGTEPVFTVTGSGMPDIERIAAVGDTLYFSIGRFRPSAGTDKLWKSDGTTGGTMLIERIPREGFSVGVFAFTAIGDRLMFLRQTEGCAESGPCHLTGELWTSDGTAGGTKLVKDLDPAGQDEATGLTEAAGMAFVKANDRELWKSDGTTMGTTMVMAFGDNGLPFHQPLTAVGSTVFLVAFDDLWKSDGTASGTELVESVTPFAPHCHDPHAPCPPVNLRDYDPAGSSGLLYFPAEAGSARGVELWRSDGTPGGTYRLKDIRAGTLGSYPSDLTSTGAHLFFVADDGNHGRELWVTDGTHDGTALVLDINDG